MEDILTHSELLMKVFLYPYNSMSLCVPGCTGNCVLTNAHSCVSPESETTAELLFANFLPVRG